MKNPESVYKQSRVEIARSLHSLLEDLNRSRERIFSRSADSIVTKDESDRITLESKLVRSHEKTIAKHQKTLDTLGLVCEIEESNLTLRTREGEPWNLPHIVLRLENGDKFIAYLKALDSSTISETEVGSLYEIIEKLLQDLEVMALKNPPSPYVIEFLGKLRRISAEYERLGRTNSLHHSFQRLNQYAEPIRGKYLKEYLIARTADILPRKPKEGFGPDTWQRDASLGGFRDQYWKGALEAVEEISRNPNAHEFFKAVISYLISSIYYAREEIIRISKRDFAYEQRVGGFIEVLDEAEATLNSLAAIKINVKPEIKA